MNNKKVNLQKEDWIQRIWDWTDKVKSREDAMGRYKNGLELIAAIYIINSENSVRNFPSLLKLDFSNNRKVLG